MAREGAKYSSAQWQHDRVSRVKSVIGYVKRKYPEWPWPAGVLEWAGSFTAKPFRPKASNRQPMPPDVFGMLVANCRRWAMTAPEEYDATSQPGRAKRLQAMWRRRDGVQFEAILRLGLNCGLDPVDIERITWDDLKLDVAVPHIQFARRKVEGKVGEAVQRVTPLVPSTVKALTQWRVFEAPHGGPVFRTARKGHYSRNCVSHTMKRLRAEAGVDACWSFKHLRNIGPTLARRARLSSDEREAFLGHVVRGTSRFYEDDVDEHYLIPVVNLIGQHYGGGEQVVATPVAST